MTLDEFRQSLLADGVPPPGLSPELAALWHDGRNDWVQAHAIVARLEGPRAAWVHAYLHRREGDSANAGYWYRHAGRPVATGDLASEWSRIAQALLAPGALAE